VKIQIITLALCVIALGIIQQANAETFILEATSETDRNDYLYIEFFLEDGIIETKNAFLKHDNYLLIFDGAPVKFYKSHGFSMKVRDMGIAIYGHPVSTLYDLEYDFTVLLQGENGRETLRFHSHGIAQENSEPVEDEPVIDPLAEYEAAQTLTGPALVSELERIAEEARLAALPVEEEQYIPELLITSSHDFRTYWQDTFNIDVQTFDGNINSDPESSGDFEGRIDGVDITILLTLDGKQIANLSGVTANNGHWDGEYYVPANISDPGEYLVEVIASYLGEIVSKSSSMFVINMVMYSDSSKPVCAEGEVLTPDGSCVAECQESYMFDKNYECIEEFPPPEE